MANRNRFVFVATSYGELKIVNILSPGVTPSKRSNPKQRLDPRRQEMVGGRPVCFRFSD